MSPEQLVSAGGNVTSLVIILWLVRHVFSHTIPRLQGDFKEALVAQHQTCASELAAQRNVFRETLEKQTEMFQTEMQYWRDRVQALEEKVAS